MGTRGASQIIGRYEVYAKIAAGGMASVHFGRLRGAAGFSRTVAIKRLHPHLAEESEFRATLVDEARLAARIHHPNVVPMLDVVDSDGELLIVMDYVRGESLSRLLRAASERERRVPLPIASAIVTGALHGLHAAHEATSPEGTPLGIVHRDVSPQNILVGIDGQARLIDFGVAKAAGRLQTTREGAIKGKIAYMAPEQLCSGEVTRQVDVYAMAVVLWEALTSKRLFHGDDEAAVLARVLVGAREPPSRHVADVPPELDALVMRGLCEQLPERFATAREMAETLTRIVPPALPTEVGAWVEETAREGLTERSTTLAEIESGSRMAIPGGAAPPPDPPKTSSRSAALRVAPIASPRRDESDEVQPLASQPSSLSIETPRPGGDASAPSPRRPLAVGAAMAVLVAAVAAFSWQLGRGGTVAAGGSDRWPEPLSASEPAPAAPKAATTQPVLDAESDESAVLLPRTVTPPAPVSAIPLPRKPPMSTRRPKFTPPVSAKSSGDPLAP